MVVCRFCGKDVPASEENHEVCWNEFARRSNSLICGHCGENKRLEDACSCRKCLDDGDEAKYIGYPGP